MKSGERSFGPPKTRAGVRTIAIPALLKPELEYHLATFAGSGKKGLLFCGPQGQPLRRASWYRSWHRALKKVGSRRTSSRTTSATPVTRSRR